MGLYVPQEVPDGEAPELAEVVRQELRRIQECINKPQIFQLDASHAAPAKPRLGMVVLADGTDWNPGSGEGFYGYHGGAWVFLSYNP